jgi:phospholipase C
VSDLEETRSTRRKFLASGALAAAGAAVTPGVAEALVRRRARPDLLAPTALQSQALAVLGRTSLRAPGSLPDPSLPAGTDTIPQIEHIVVLMMENHSYDNFFGMLGRGPYQLPRGDGFTIASDGYPANSNPTSSGGQQRAFVMPTTCQFSGSPTQEWDQCHTQYANGTNQGFVVSGSGVVAMGYWTGDNLPFTYDLAGVFPIGDRWFCSMLGQTDGNRRFLIGATALGMTDDVGKAVSQDASLLLTPPNGTIFSVLQNAGISWMEYVDSSSKLTGSTESLFPTVDLKYEKAHVAPFSQFLTDTAAGSLPAFTLLDPNFDTESQEDPQNIVLGEAFMSQVVQALGASPAWQQTILIITYDEHGGYYDHVPPPIALAPDKIPPFLVKGDKPFDGFHRYGFRVPSVVVGPYAKPNYVSHLVYDHTSVLAFVERKFNLPAMTYRDANANDLTDFLDMDALSSGTPTFPELPALAAPGNTPEALACSTTGPGSVPPPQPPPLPITARFTSVAASASQNGIVADLQASRSSLSSVQVQLQQGGTTVASRTLAVLSVPVREVVLRVGGGLPSAGTYTVLAIAGGVTLATQTVTVP